MLLVAIGIALAVTGANLDGGHRIKEGDSHEPTVVVRTNDEITRGFQRWAYLMALSEPAPIVAPRVASGEAPVPLEVPGAGVPVLLSGPAGAPEIISIICAPEWEAFCRGYRDFGGRPEWERHFVDDVLACEGAHWAGYYGVPYWSRAQFSGDTWLKVRAAFGVVDAAQAEFADSAYWTGAAVAWWSNAIDYPGGTGGWPSCWWEGIVP